MHLEQVFLHPPLWQGPLLLKVGLHLLFPHLCQLFCLALAVHCQHGALVVPG